MGTHSMVLCVNQNATFYNYSLDIVKYPSMKLYSASRTKLMETIALKIPGSLFFHFINDAISAQLFFFKTSGDFDDNFSFP